MSILYRLTPPFLYVPEESSFPDAWEAFCCKLLKLEHATTDIFRRNPPEQGIDLFEPSRGYAYQYKSVESGKSGDFNASHALASYRSALKVQPSVGWKRYVLCTNVTLTGTAEASLKKEIPDLLILPASHWVGLCEANASAVARNFRTVIDVQPRQVSRGAGLLDVAAIFGDEEPQAGSDCFSVLLYSNKHDAVYRLPVRGGMLVGDLQEALEKLFELPRTFSIASENISVTLSHNIIVAGQPVSSGKTLAEAGIGPNSIVTYWTEMKCRDVERGASLQGNVMHMQTALDLRAYKSIEDRRYAAIGICNSRLKRRFAEVDALLSLNSAPR